ncbi:nose resistant to fluoxetine protein 6-like [Homalodisca vitripennis]|uniref:nose resistant to fluoxetine protein 6-like n=1 Tax=Homalodisca vitripennis TaxID=197043 RepID=UPI001EECC7BA|nr:nose resistant to fluoxetine protein 6-like [Homalodisca vitripennis]
MELLVLAVLVTVTATRGVPLAGPADPGVTVAGWPEDEGNSTEEAGFIDLSLVEDAWPEDASNASREEGPQKPWSGWIYKAMAEGMIRLNITSREAKCSNDGRMYRQHLNNLTLWAARMFDASALSPNGFISGDIYQFGHFDECIAIDNPVDKITGKYCLATIRYGPDPQVRPQHYSPPAPLYKPLPPHASVWDRLKVTNDPRVIRRDLLRWAVCVPSSCSAADIQDSLAASLAGPLQDESIRADVHHSLRRLLLYSMMFFKRRSRFPVVPPARPRIHWGILYGMALLCLAGTVLDYATNDQTEVNKSLRKFIKVFSSYANIKKLVKSNPEADFKLLHCFKFLSMMCVILGHKEMYRFGKPVQNISFVEEFSKQIPSMLFLNGGGYIVDTFFLFSGFLTCHFLVKELEKKNSVNLFTLIIGKLLRILPLYGFVIAFHGEVLPYLELVGECTLFNIDCVTSCRILPLYGFVIAFHGEVLPYLGHGPLWNSLVWREALRCQKNWWANVLFLNNYINTEETCMIQTWYLACDMHYFIIGILLIYIKFRHPKLGNTLIAAAFVAAAAIPAYITYVNQYKGVVQLYHELQKDPAHDEHFRTMYVPSHVRFMPYMVGLILSYVCQYLEKTGYKFPGLSLFVIIPLGIAVNLSTTFVAYVFYIEERPYSLLESVLYAGVHRILWAGTLGIYIIVDSTTGIGKWGSLFRHPAWAPLGRLTYCAFLIHTIPMLYTTGQMRAAPYHSRMMAAMSLLGEVALSFFFALLLNLVFESPFQRMQKMLFKKQSGGSGKSGLTQRNIAQTVDSQLNLTCGISKISYREENGSNIAFTDENGTRISYRDENGRFKS